MVDILDEQKLASVLVCSQVVIFLKKVFIHKDLLVAST